MTRRWCSDPPVDGSIKVFLVDGDGSALLTLDFTESGINVKQEPDVYPVRSS